MVSAETIQRQAWMTAADWMENAVTVIDEQFGAGFAKKYPELVAAFMKTAATDQAGMYLRCCAEALEQLQQPFNIMEKE